MKVRFWIRKQQGNPTSKVGILYATITINKVRSLPLSTGITVKKNNWNAKAQDLTGRDSIYNDDLNDIKSQLKEIKEQQQAAKKSVTSESVRLEWLKQQQGPTTLFNLMDKFDSYQRQFGKGKKGKPLTEGTFDQYKTNRAYLIDFVANNKQLPLNPELINNNWMLQFEKYLMNRTGKRKLQQSTVNFVINYIKQVLKFSISNEDIKTAPAIFFKISPARSTTPHPLAAEQLKLFELGNFTNAQRRAVDCFLFLTYTGLHYIDGRNISDKSILYDGGKEYLKVIRQKTEEPAYIPYHPKAKAIAEKYGGLDCLPFTDFNNMNSRLKEAAKQISINRNITPGTGRDTFADYCSNDIGVSDESLAAMLGHTTTNYVKKIETHINKAYNWRVERMIYLVT